MDEFTIDREAMGQLASINVYLRRGPCNRSRDEESRCKRHGAGHQNARTQFLKLKC